MSKGNLFLGFGRGSVGDVVFSHLDGEQVARARNRSPRNPRTPIQLLQRTCLKTCSSAYSLLQDICNHSFQGCTEGTMSQAAFNKLNIDKVRTQLAFEINSGDPDDILMSGESNFAKRNSVGAEINPYIVSDGKLSTIAVSWLTVLATPKFGINVNLGKAAPTYQEVCDALGLVRGDQLTFLALSCDDTVEGAQFNGFEYCRVILDPSDANMSQPFLSGSSINMPNDKNKGLFDFAIENNGGSYYLTFSCPKFTNAAAGQFSVCASTVIVSRFSGNVWARSSQSLVIRSYVSSVSGHLSFDHGTDYLGDAVNSYMTDESSSLYLNQAGVSAQDASLLAHATLSSVTIGSQHPTRNQVIYINTAVAVSASIQDAQDGHTYKLQVYEVDMQDNRTLISEAAFTGTSATIASRAYNSQTYDVCLSDNGVVVDTFCHFGYDSD